MRNLENVMPTLLGNKALRARVHCPICTHTVQAEVVTVGDGWNRRKMKVVEGQKCGRCSATLDAAYILEAVGPLNG